jgi:GTP-binding protein HflX
MQMLHPTAPQPERTLLVGVDTGRDRRQFTAEMDELASLAAAAGADVVGRIEQRREAVEPSTLIGRGKVAELAERVREANVSLVVTLNALRPRQRAALERALPDVLVVDRTVLILDIFAAHARTSEGKLQVELAQLRHRAANLIGSRAELSRLGGGIGTRGPGETKLEVDRRRIRLRIAHLEAELARVRRRRAEQRRSRSGTPVAALVGYTNAGKSSLLNALAGTQTYVADQPFATLDPLLRSLDLPGGRRVILADTVGFISDLPKELIAAFRATLEEVTNATLLIHVLDVSNPLWRRQRDAVSSVLRDIGAAGKPTIYAWNKIDRIADYQGGGGGLGEAGVLVSAVTGAGLPALRDAVAAAIESPGGMPPAGGSPSSASSSVGYSGPAAFSSSSSAVSS